MESIIADIIGVLDDACTAEYFDGMFLRICIILKNIITYGYHLHSRDLKNISFASITSLYGILNSLYRGMTLSGEPNSPHKFLLWRIQSFSSPPIVDEHSTDSCLTVFFSETNMADRLVICSILCISFFIASFKNDLRLPIVV